MEGVAWREVVAMAVAIEEGTCKRVRQVKTAIGELGCWWLGYARRRGCCRSGLEGESARSEMVTVTVKEVVIAIGEVYVI